MGVRCLLTIHPQKASQGHRVASSMASGVQGRTYLCKKLDLSSKVAVVRPADLKYYTKTRDFTDIYVIGGKTAYSKPMVYLHALFLACLLLIER